MKKLVCSVVALGMMLMPITAEEINQDSEPQSGKTIISTEIDPTYEVVIPESTAIEFEAETTELGSVKANWVQIDPGKKVLVSVDAGELQNQEDPSKTIPYELVSDEEAFTSMDILSTEDKAVIQLKITKENWNKAFAGKYKGTIVFHFSYVDKQ